MQQLLDVAVHRRTQALSWDLALPRMRVGEMVRLDCSPTYAYGDAGAPPLIPPGSSMTFELELLSVRDLMNSHNPEEVRDIFMWRERERSIDGWTDRRCFRSVA